MIYENKMEKKAVLSYTNCMKQPLYSLIINSGTKIQESVMNYAYYVMIGR